MKKIDCLKEIVSLLVKTERKYFKNKEFQNECQKLNKKETAELFDNNHSFDHHIFIDCDYMHMQIAGCASWIKYDAEDIEALDDKIEILKKYALCNNKKLLSWIDQEGDNYPTLSSYYLMMDQMRLYLLELFSLYKEDCDINE